jgi:hypothetical protein
MNYQKSRINFIKTIVFTITLIVGSAYVNAQNKILPLKSFDKVIVSPHIQVEFVHGDKESITIEDISVPFEKFNIEQSGSTVHIYLDDAKMTTKNEKEKNKNYNVKHPIYNGTIVRAIITFKNLEDLSLRGEEDFRCDDKLKTDKFKLKIYGESNVYFKDVEFNSLHTTIYGESYFVIKNGKIGKQKIITYGESEVNTMDVETETVKITAYGESDIRVHASKNIKITSYGEARIKYKGNPDIDKGIVIGDAIIRSVD